MKHYFFWVTLCALSLLSCSKDDDNGSGNQDFQSIKIKLENIADLGLDYTYYLWWGYNGDTVLVRELEGGSYIDFEYDGLDPSKLVDGSSLIVTAKNFNDGTSPKPSDFPFLFGEFVGGKADLTTDILFNAGRAELASGSFQLMTPTTISRDDEDSGIWYVGGTSPDFTPGLSIPILRGPWIYEAWIEKDGFVVPVGKFNDPSGPDQRNHYIGFEGPPLLFPGEDYIRQLPNNWSTLSLQDAKTFVTIEPTDRNLGPFFLQILSADIAENAQTARELPLLFEREYWPVGTAEFK